MKCFIIALLILTTVLTCGFISMHKLENTSEAMLYKTLEITSAIKNDDFSTALRLTDELSDFVDNNTLLFATMMDHNSITGIEVYIGELKYYISGGIKYNALAKSAVLERLIRNLPENYTVKLENIL